MMAVNMQKDIPRLFNVFFVYTPKIKKVVQKTAKKKREIFHSRIASSFLLLVKAMPPLTETDK